MKSLPKKIVGNAKKTKLLRKKQLIFTKNEMPSLPKSIYQWSIENVSHWMKENGFEEEIRTFKEHEIDGRALALVYRCDLKELIKRVGPRVKFRAKLSQLLTSRGMKNNLNPNDTSKSNNQFYDGNYQTQQGYTVLPVYPQNCGPQYIQRTRPYQQNNQHNKANSYSQPQQQQQQQQQQNPSQNLYYNQHQQQQPIKSNYPTNQPINCCRPNFSTNGNAVITNNQPVYGAQTCNCVTVKTSDFRSVTQPGNSSLANNSNNNVNNHTFNPPAQNIYNPKQNTESGENNDQVEITKFLKGSGFKQEPIETLENLCSPSHSLNIQSSNSNNENVDPYNEKTLCDEGGTFEDNNDVEDLTMTQDDEEISNAMENDEHFPVIEIDVEFYEDKIKSENGEGFMQCNNNSKLGIEAVTKRLALREKSKIFRRSDKKWHVAVNEIAFQLVLKDPKLLMRKKDLRNMAETEVRKTYCFAKGKSRSIAIPANREAAKVKKKQRLTKEKIDEMKRQVSAEGDEVNRRVQQCHINLRLATQQSDLIKVAQLRAEIQTLSQQQAKLHFTMDDLLTKEKKVEAGSKILMPTMNSLITSVNPNNDMTEITQQQQQQQLQQQQQQQQQPSFFVEHSMNHQESLSPQATMLSQQATMLSQQYTTHSIMLPHQCNSQATMASPQNTTQSTVVSTQRIPQPTVLSPQSTAQATKSSQSVPISQVHVDKCYPINELVSF